MGKIISCLIFASYVSANRWEPCAGEPHQEIYMVNIYVYMGKITLCYQCVLLSRGVGTSRREYVQGDDSDGGGTNETQ